MKRIKKIVFLLLFMLFIPVVSAGSFSVSSNYTSPTVGTNIIVTVRADNAAGKFSVSSSNGAVLSGGGSEWIENGSATFSFKANSSGTAQIIVSPDDVSDSSNGSVISGSKTITINVKDKVPNNTTSNNTSGSNSRPSTNPKPNVTTPRVLSSINYLSSLSIDGVSLNPVFDKNNTEYEVVLENGTNKVNVIGERESSTSYVTGLGEVPVSEGVNFINVVVTAENGAKRTYIIKATVLEKEPIVVNVNDKSMTLVRKVEAMPSASDYYVSSTIKINDEDIPCYVSEITGYTLVGLKGNDGNIGLYRYDKDSNSYFDYKEFGFNFLRISLLDSLTVPKDYTVGSIKINEQDVTAYIKEGEYPLIYGVNLENGVESFYSYDEEENTIQRFSVLDDSDNYDKYYPYIIIGLIGFIIIQFIIMIIVVISKNKKQRKLLLNKLDTKTEFEKKVSSDVKLADIVGNSDDSSLENKVVSKKDKKKLKKINKKLKDDDMYKF